MDIRIGIATGPVVVGDLIGEGASQESAVVGETPNLAARLQALADNNSVLVSPRTHELSAGQFEFVDLGKHELKGISAPVNAWKALAPVASESRFEATHRDNLTNLIGRDHEVGLLVERWSQAREGDGQVVIVSGEAGIGKSRLLEVLRRRTGDRNRARLQFQCSPFHINSAFYPVIVHLEQLAQFSPSDSPKTRLDKLEMLLKESLVDGADQLSLFANLLSIPSGGRCQALDLSPEQQKEETLEKLVARVESLAIQQPVLMLFEDMHWADPTTIELMDRLVERIQRVRLMVVITTRPEFVPPWTGQMDVTYLALNRLGRSAAGEMVSKVTGGYQLPEELTEHIVAKTDGIPLFVEELTKTVLESGLVKRIGDSYELTGPLSKVEIPSTLHDSLMARLDRIPQAKSVAQTAAAMGREFTHEMLSAVSNAEKELLESSLEQLIQAELVFRFSRAVQTRYGFKHALVQDAAYTSMPKKTRRALHERIATVIEAQFSETVQTEPEVLAHHYTAADLPAPASKFWLAAGNRAMERSADYEAVGHLKNALVNLEALPDSPERDSREIEIQTGLFRSCTHTQGWGSKEARNSHERVRELGEGSGDLEVMLTVLVGDRIKHWTRAEYPQALEVADKLARLGGIENIDQRTFAMMMRGWPAMALGQVADLPDTARDILEHYDAERQKGFMERYGLDLKVVAWSMLAYHELLCGTQEATLSAIGESVQWARQINHIGSLKWALFWAGAQPAAMTGDVALAETFATELVTIPAKRRSPLDEAWGRLLAGWALAKRGDHERGLGMMTNGESYLWGEEVKMFRSVRLALMAEVCIEAGQHAVAFSTLDDARAHIENTGERVWESEILRLRGNALLSKGESGNAAECFERAVAVANVLDLTVLRHRAESDLAACR